MARNMIVISEHPINYNYFCRDKALARAHDFGILDMRTLTTVFKSCIQAEAYVSFVCS
jgi:hypothetical protein